MPNFCSNCGQSISDNVKFCPECGTKIPAPSNEEQPSTIQPPDKRRYVNEQTDVVRKCPSCGTTITDLYSPHCPNCNKNIYTNLIVTPINKKRSTGEWIAIVCGGLILLVILSALISGIFKDNYNYCSENYPGTTYDPVSKLCEKIGTQTHAQQTSIVGKKTDLKIGDSVVLTSNDESVSIKVINIGSTSYSSHQVQVEIKNVGKKAVEGNSVVEVWITDYADVKHRSSLESITDSIWHNFRGSKYDPYPFYPGDATTMHYDFNLDDKALKGKLTFYYKFWDQTASWIIKTQ